MEMDPQGKIWLHLKVTKHCVLSCYVTAPDYMVPIYSNDKTTVVDNDGVGHPAIINLCPRNAQTIDIAEFMDIYVKIKRLLDDEENNNNIAVVPNN